MRPLDVRVVVNLDPPGRGIQPEGVGQPGQKPCLGGAFGHPAGQAFARIAQGVGHQFGLLATSRHHQPHLAPGLLRKRLGQQLLILHPVAENHLPRRLPAGVELSDKGLHHLGRLHSGGDTGEIIAVAPVLVGTDEEHFHTGLSALDMQRDDIGLGHPPRVDALGLLHLGQGADAVAQGGGALELQRPAGFFHLAGQILLQAGGPALQKALGVTNQGGVIGLRDPPHARRAAAPDLVKKARPCAAFEHGIRAVAQLERLLQLVERAIHRRGTGKGAVIGALLPVRAAVLADLRKGMLEAQHDLGKGLVVAQQHIVARLELLDEVLLQKQRLGFRPGGEEHHRGGLGDHPRNPGAVASGLGVGRHPLAQAARLADVENRAPGIEHAIDTRRVVEAFQVVPDHLMAPRNIRLRSDVFCSAHGLPGDSPVAAILRVFRQVKTCPRNMWITLVTSFNDSKYFLVFVMVLHFAHFFSATATT